MKVKSVILFLSFIILTSSSAVASLSWFEKADEKNTKYESTINQNLSDKKKSKQLKKRQKEAAAKKKASERKERVVL